MTDKPLAYLVYVHQSDCEYRLFAEESEAEEAAADAADRHGVATWDVIPLHPGEPITIEVE